MVHNYVVGIVVFLASVVSAQVPPELIQAEDYLRNFVTGEATWVETTSCGKELFTVKYAEGQELLQSHGNPELSCGRSMSGDGPKWGRYGSRYWLFEDIAGFPEGVGWSHSDGSHSVYTMEWNGPMLPFSDIRATPFLSRRGQGVRLDNHATFNPETLRRATRKAREVVRGPIPPVEYTTYQKDGAFVVEARYEDLALTRWHLNPAEGYRCEMTELVGSKLVDGVLEDMVFHRGRTEYGEFDGVPFPSEVTWEVVGYETNPDGSPVTPLREIINKVMSEMILLDASFNKPWQPDRFSLRDIGAKMGHPIQSSRGIKWWNGYGQQLMEFDEWKAWGRESTENTHEYERWSRALAKSDRWGTLEYREAQYAFLADSVPTKPGLWETYVRRFIGLHKLSIGQCKTAWTALHECQEKAHAYSSEQEEAFAALARLEVDKEKSEQAAKQRKKLLRPIQTIFEKKLVRELERLLTIEQRRVATKALDE